MSNSNWPDETPYLDVNRDELKTMLLGVRNAASGRLAALIMGGETPPTLTGARAALNTVRDATAQGTVGDDLRAVRHAAEIALALLMPGYLPAREAMFDVFALVERYPMTEAELRAYQDELFGEEVDET